MEKKSIEIADELEQIELALRQGEIKSIFVSVNYGDTSHNIICGSALDIGTSLSHYCRDNNRSWQTLIGISEVLAKI